jgi:hypothetical protein
MSEKLNKPEQEEFYDILQNSSGDLLISIKAREGGPEEPKIVYDGGEHALLYRSKGFSITLDFIHPEAREPLANVDSVLIVEFDNDEVVREYDVPVKKVKKLPIAAENLPKLP